MNLDPEVYLQAAQRIRYEYDDWHDFGHLKYACWAIGHNWDYINYYAYWFKPEGEKGSWFCDGNFLEPHNWNHENQLARQLSLLFMYEIARDE